MSSITNSNISSNRRRPSRASIRKVKREFRSTAQQLETLVKRESEISNKLNENDLGLANGKYLDRELKLVQAQILRKKAELSDKGSAFNRIAEKFNPNS